MRILVLVSLLSALALLVDVYVFRNWRAFARARAPLRWTLVAFMAGLLVMPLVLPLYFALSQWWHVEPRFWRQLVIGVWAVWYLPKAPIAVVLLVRDAARFSTWLFHRLQARLASETRGGDIAELAHISRKEFLQKVGWTAATVPFVVVGYGVFRGLYDFQIRHVDVPIPNLPRALHGLRIAQVSDLHAGSLSSDRPMLDAVALTLQQRPDLIAITGDFVNHDHREAALILPALTRLAAPLGVYAVRGNHDHYADVGRVSEMIRDAGIDLLVNAGRTLAIDGARLHVLGTDNTGFGQRFGDLGAALAGTAPAGDDAHLLLAHDPTFWDADVRQRGTRIDLTLSGHTHGGQFGVELGPLRWSLARPVYPRWAGLYSEEHRTGAQHLYVNRGLGTVGPPVRLGIRPEITVLTLVRVDTPTGPIA
jgi:uncharacterized protein